MNISEPFIKRPVMTSLLMITICFFGFLAYKSLPVSDLPNVDYPTIEVTVSYPGATPETVANTCTTPLEKEFMTIDGLDNITSTSSQGSSTIVLQFILKKSMDSASLDVQAAINRAQPNLPSDLPYNPTYRKVNPSSTPILYLALTSPTMPLSTIYDYGNTYVGQRISMIDGVSQVNVYGSPYAVRIQLDPLKLAAKGIGIEEVVKSIQEGNVDLPTGTLFGPKEEYTINAKGKLTDASMYENLTIKTKDGNLIKLSQVGRALDSLQNDKIYLHFATNEIDREAIILAIQRQPGQNTVAVIKEIDKLLPEIQKQFPPSLEITRIFDKSESILEGVKEVKLTLIIAFFLVLIVIFFYLGKFFHTLIPILALPMSILGTFAIMWVFNFSLDILSLLAITLCIGFLVDDAIVVLENCTRHVQMNEKPFDAAIKGSKEISLTIFSISLCLIIVFFPMLFMKGIVGRLFLEFAATIVSAVFFSGFVSLTLTPLLSSRLIPKMREQKSKMELFSEKMNEKLLKFYEKRLIWVLNHTKTTLTIALLTIGSSILLFVILPKSFLPDDDSGFLQGFTRARDGTSPFLMAKYQKDLTDIILKDHAVENVLSIGSYGNDNEGLFFIRLKSYKERGNINPIISRLLKDTSSEIGIQTFISTIPLISLESGTGGMAPYQYTLFSLNQDTLYQSANLIEKEISSLNGFTQVSSDLLINQPQLKLEILRDRASALNVRAADIENLLSYAYSDGKISLIHGDINQYDVIVETLPEFYKSPQMINSLYVHSTKNELIPLDQIIKKSEVLGPLSINHFDGLPSATVSFNLANLPLGTAVNMLENLQSKKLFPEVIGKVQGTANVFKESFSNLIFLFILTIFLIYIILGILYENFFHPLTVMSALAPATFGGLLSLYLFQETLSLYSFVGLILLLGIVLKNGILMVDFAIESKRNEKLNSKESIFKACMIRFRPIMMTTLAAAMGAIPIAIGLGGSAASSRRPMGYVVVGGLMISQILTLLLTPVIYLLIENLQEKLKKLFAKDADETEKTSL